MPGVTERTEQVKAERVVSRLGKPHRMEKTMSDRDRDDSNQRGQRRSQTNRQGKLSSPRADAFGSGRQYRWTETADDPFDKGRYWDIHNGTD